MCQVCIEYQGDLPAKDVMIPCFDKMDFAQEPLWVRYTDLVKIDTIDARKDILNCPSCNERIEDVLRIEGLVDMNKKFYTPRTRRK